HTDSTPDPTLDGGDGGIWNRGPLVNKKPGNPFSGFQGQDPAWMKHNVPGDPFSGLLGQDVNWRDELGATPFNSPDEAGGAEDDQESGHSDAGSFALLAPDIRRK